MKRGLLISLLCVLMMFSACQADENVQTENNSQITLNAFDGVTLQSKEVIVDGDDVKLDVIWKNETEYEVLYGEAFRVQRYINGEWTACESGESNAFYSIAILLEPNSERTKTYNVSNYYKVSSVGQYRLLTEYSVTFSSADDITKRYTAVAEFELTEEGYSIPDVQINGVDVNFFDGKAPPTLYMLLDNAKLDGMGFGYSWNHASDDGEFWECIEADTLHPLQVHGLELLGNVTLQTAVLAFNAEPESVSVSYWSDDKLNDTSAPETKLDCNKLGRDKYAFELKAGSNIYYVKATFKEDKYYGNVEYCFYINAE